MMEKRCSKCFEFKILSEFSKSLSSKDGFQYVCKKCHKTYYQKNKSKILKQCQVYRSSNLDKVRKSSNRSKLKKRYNISPEELERLKINQDYKCKICNKKANKLHLDHSHKTGLIRGVLCYSCNYAIGLFKDDPNLCINAAKYLQEFSC